MSNPRNMDEPVTRRELHEALDLWAGAILSQMSAQFAQADARFAAMEQRISQRLSEEMSRHIRASEENTRTLIAALDDKYRDLPPRVTRLETKVFAPKRRRVAKARRRR